MQSKRHFGEIKYKVESKPNFAEAIEFYWIAIGESLKLGKQGEGIFYNLVMYGFKSLILPLADEEFKRNLKRIEDSEDIRREHHSQTPSELFEKAVKTFTEIQQLISRRGMFPINIYDPRDQEEDIYDADRSLQDTQKLIFGNSSSRKSTIPPHNTKDIPKKTDS